MLLCFSKDSPGIKGSIVSLIDRIWIRENGDADVMRRFWIKVDSNSPDVSRIRCFIPYERERLYDIRDLSEYSKDPNYPFNNPERFETGLTEIKKEREENTLDGIKYKVRMFGKNWSVDTVGEGTVLNIDLERTPLSPNSTYLLHVKYSLRNFVDISLIKKIGDTPFDLAYFSHDRTPSMCSYIQENRVIPIVPILPLQRGGFSVFLYPPHKHELLPSPGSSAQPVCSHDYEGNSIKLVAGHLWYLHKIMEEHSKDPLRETIKLENRRFNFALKVSGTMRKQILYGDIEKTTILTWISIGIAIGSFVLFIIWNIFLPLLAQK